MSKAAVSVQFAWFGPLATSVKAASFFTALFGREPDSYQENKTLTPAMPFLGAARMIEQGIQYSVQVSPGRIDVNLARAEQNEIPLSERPVVPIFDLKPAISDLIEKVESLTIHDFDWVIRVAATANIAIPAENYADATRMFADAVNPALNLSTDMDLVYQNNRRCAVPSLNAEINRIVRLSVDTFALMEFAGPGMQFGGPIMMGNQAPTPHFHREQCALIMLLDLNIHPTGRTYPIAEQAIAFRFIGDELLRLSAKSPLSMVNVYE